MRPAMRRLLTVLLLLFTTVLAVSAKKAKWQCDTNLYSSKQIQKTLAHARRTVGRKGFEVDREYPHVYNNREGIRFNKPKTGTLMEFPIFKTSLYQNGQKSMKDRVLYNDAGNFVGIITHSGAARGKFVPCHVLPKKGTPGPNRKQSPQGPNAGKGKNKKGKNKQKAPKQAPKRKAKGRNKGKKQKSNKPKTPGRAKNKKQRGGRKGGRRGGRR